MFLVDVLFPVDGLVPVNVLLLVDLLFPVDVFLRGGAVATQARGNAPVGVVRFADLGALGQKGGRKSEMCYNIFWVVRKRTTVAHVVTHVKLLST